MLASDTKDELASAARKYWNDDGYSRGGGVREVDYPALPKGLHPSLQGIKIVDCDTHFTEPPDLFTTRAPAKYKDLVPRHRRVNGVDRWAVGDRDFGSIGGNVIFPDNNKLLGRLAFPVFEEGHPGAYQVKPRLQVMDDLGIYAQICFQNSGVTQAGSLMSLGDSELGKLILKIYNDAAAERQHESGQRLFTLAHLPVWDKAALEAEARRCLDMGLKGFVLPDLPERLGVTSYVDPYWTSFFELCEDRGAPLNFHLNAAMDGNRLAWGGMKFESVTAVGSMMYYIGNAATMGNFMASGLLDRHPRLKIGLIESGLGWVPFAIESMEHMFDEMLAGLADKPQKRPWEYFRENFWVTYWYEMVGPTRLL